MIYLFTIYIKYHSDNINMFFFMFCCFKNIYKIVCRLFFRSFFILIYFSYAILFISFCSYIKKVKKKTRNRNKIVFCHSPVMANYCGFRWTLWTYMNCEIAFVQKQLKSHGFYYKVVIIRFYSHRFRCLVLQKKQEHRP